MVTYLDRNQAFIYRVAAVIVDGDRVLLHRSAQDSFWSLPGGRAEIMEASADALAREMREELGCEVDVERLLWLVESFFPYQGKQQHEIGLYFLVHLPPGERFYSGETEYTGYETCRQEAPGEALPLFFRWFPRDPAALSEAGLVPVFLRAALAQLPEEIVHIVNHETDANPIP